MAHRICWQQDSVDRILQTEALAGEDSVFLATHFPIEGFDTEGSRASEISAATEHALLDALSRDTQRHAFCVVRGEPGSGKSHLIRWLSIQWRRRAGTDLVLLIQRADGSLESTLKQLRQALPEDADAALSPNLGGGGSVSFAGRVGLFHSALGLAMKAGFLQEEREDRDWCEKWQLEELLLFAEVRNSWKAPSRILEIVSGRGGERNSELAQFQLEDVRELVRLGDAAEGRKMAHIRFLRILRDELQAVDEPANQNRPLAGLAPETTNLLRALNARLNPAIQYFLGISPDGLKELFRRVRRKLRTEGRRLVLLLEDITSFQGVDNQLVDVLVTDSQTRADECDLISVVGLTPYYFAQFIQGRGNIFARITHGVRLGRGEHGFESVTSLATPDSQVRFAAKYLNAVRLGIERLQDGSRVPNACEDCPVAAPCLKAFGSRDGHSLYPVTETYVTRNFDRLTDPEGRLTHKTPRGLLQNLLHPALFHVEDLERGSYPPPEFPVAPILGAKDVAGPVRDRLNALNGSEGADFGRMLLLVGLWGNGSPSASTIRNAAGELEFVGIPQSVFEVFQAPWPGGEPGSIPPLPPQGQEEPVSASPSNNGPGATELPIGGEPLPRLPSVKPQPVNPPPPRSPQPRAIRTGDLAVRVRQLAAWENDGRLEDETFWNQQLYDSVEALRWEQLGIPYYLRRRLFTRELVQLQGTGRPRSMHFVVPREQWVYRGLHGVVTLSGRSRDSDIELMLSYVARFRRQLQKLAVAHVRKRMSTFALEDGTTWDPAHTAVQLLAARAWLRGDTTPEAEPSEQWRVLLSDEAEADSAPRQRVESWGEFVTATGGSHGMFRRMLHEWYALPQGSQLGTDLVDAAGALRALRDLTKQVAYSRLPPTAPASPGNQFSEITSLCEKAIDTRTKLAGLPGREAERLRGRATELYEVLRGNSVPEHLARIDRAIFAVLKYLPDAAPVSVKEWKEQGVRLRAAGYATGPEATKVEDFLFAVDNAPSEPAALLQWCLNAPVQALSLIKATCDSGEETIARMADIAAAYVGEHQLDGTAIIEHVHEIGTRLARAADGMEARLRDE